VNLIGETAILSQPSSYYSFPLMSSQSQQQQQQYQPRISMTAIIESDVPELKSFLFRFFEGAKVFAKIRHEINNSTSILVQGHPKLVPASMAYLKDLLLIRFDGAPMTCSDLFPTEDSDRLESVMIEETPVGLRRDNSSGEFREIPLQDISFGGSAATEDIKKMLQETVAAISPLGRAVGVVKTDRMHVSVQCGNTRRVVEVSGMTSLTVLYNEISKKFKSSVPVHYIYKIDGDGVVVVVTDIRDLETGVVYNVKTVNDPEPKPGKNISNM
jgi:hypothetical protein